MAGSVTVGADGSLTLPPDIVDGLGVSAGDQLTFEQNTQGGFVLYPARKSAGPKKLADMYGCLESAHTVSVEEILEAVQNVRDETEQSLLWKLSNR